MGRFFDALNTPIAVLVVLVVVVGLNAFLYFAHRSSETPSASPAEHGGHLQKTTTMVEGTQRRAGPKEATQPATTLQSTTPTQPSATASATSSSSP